jgi:hypothetical protein
MNSPMGNSLLNRKKKHQTQQNKKGKENSNFQPNRNEEINNSEKPCKDEIYQTSILGRALGNLEGK